MIVFGGYEIVGVCKLFVFSEKFICICDFDMFFVVMLDDVIELMYV